MEIKNVVIPAAGRGTRLLPLTKVVPKELIPLLPHKPAIHYGVEEALHSGLNNLIMITGRGKNQLADYFDHTPELELALEELGKKELLSDIEKIIRTAHFTYIRQHEPLGLGHAVWMARHAIGKEYFGVLLPDDIVVGQTPGLAQLIRIARQEKGSVIAVQEVPAECISSYGVIGVRKQITPNLYQVSHVVEKPDQKNAPSNLAIIGRYVLSHKVFASLEEISSYTVGELQLTDAIGHMMKNNEKVFAYKIQGTRYDVGTPIGWIKAVIGIALQDPVFGPHIKKYLNDMYGVDSFLYNHTKNIEHTL